MLCSDSRKPRRLESDDPHRQHAGFAFGYHVGLGGCVIGFEVHCLPDVSGDLSHEGGTRSKPDGCLLIFFPRLAQLGGPRVRMLPSVAAADQVARQLAVSTLSDHNAVTAYFLGS